MKQEVYIKVPVSEKPEVWKDIEGFEGLYQVSNTGKVKSIAGYNKKFKKDIILKPLLLKGYHQYSLSKNGVQKCFLAHRLIANAFIPNPHNKPFVNHLDKVRGNNHVDNLEWCTQMENNKHCVINMSTSLNKKAPTLETVRAIYQDGRTLTEIGKDWGVTPSHISLIKNKKIWAEETAGLTLGVAAKKKK